MKRVSQVFALVLLLVGVYYLYEASRLPFWKSTTFGSGFFPLVLGVILVAVTGIMLIKFSMERDDGSSAAALILPPRDGRVRLACLVAAMVVATLVFELLGFVVTSFLLLSFTFIMLEPEHKKKVQVAMAGGTVLIFYIFFILMLRTQLPKGLLG